ncbi:hypothetical protein MNBD_ALPHA12-515 [hydrothermal vent metagenome]|uniref:Uncharacterized protein n=1 Tax=hydrothermal vent metagenome TaxID=652676 RepID=A0A3B0TB25_9ZZZZ
MAGVPGKALKGPTAARIKKPAARVKARRGFASLFFSHSGFSFVIPAQAGIQSFLCHLHTKRWTPVFTGVTLRGFVYYFAFS